MKAIYNFSKVCWMLVGFAVGWVEASELPATERHTSKLSHEQLSEVLADIYSGPERVARQIKSFTRGESGPSREELKTYAVGGGASYNAFLVVQVPNSENFQLFTPETYVSNPEEGRSILFFVDSDEGGNIDSLVRSERLNPKNRICVLTGSKDSPLLAEAHDTIVVSSTLKEQSHLLINPFQTALYFVYNDFHDTADYVFKGVGNDMSAVVESDQTSGFFRNLAKITLGPTKRIFTLGSKQDCGYGLAMEQARLLRETSTKPVECKNIDDLSDDFEQGIRPSDAIILFLTRSDAEDSTLKEKVSELAIRLRDKTTRIIVVRPNTSEFAFWSIPGTKVAVPPAKDASTWNKYGYLTVWGDAQMSREEMEQIQSKDFGVYDWIKGAAERFAASQMEQVRLKLDEALEFMVTLGQVSFENSQSPLFRSAIMAEGASQMTEQYKKSRLGQYFDDWQDELLNSYGRVFSMGVVAQLLAYHHAMALLESGRG